MVLDDKCGLMSPIQRKSIEPLAAHIDPLLHVQARQWLHHPVDSSAWSDEAVLAEVHSIIEPLLGLEEECFWIIDDTGIPKQGRYSVSVARQDCGPLGKTEKLGMPEDVGFAPPNAIALAQVKHALEAGVTSGTVLADPAYGNSAAFRDQLSAWGFIYAVGVVLPF